jgi:putative transposase
MSYNPKIHHRRSIRLKGYDYSQTGLYFITFCCQDRACLFGNVINGKMILNAAGKIADTCWLEIPDHFPQIVLHKHVIMPNHVHGIIEIVGEKRGSCHGRHVGAKNISPPHISHPIIPPLIIPPSIIPSTIISPQRPPRFLPKSPSQTIGSFVRGYKIGVTKWMRQNTSVYDVWQRDYYERIIWNDHAYQLISRYITNNPTKWRGR